jgi:copper homeostasis protein (lipoprotein)
MNRKLLVASIALISIAFVACKREAPAPTPAPAPELPAVTAVTQPAAQIASDVVPREASGFHGKAFAGMFTGTLPCADCSGIDETLELKTDGSFTLTDAYRGRPQGTQTVAGNWTTEDNDKRLRLSSSGKTEQDHLYAIASHDEVAALGRDGKQADGPALHRSP